jgi:hypothetical protein
VLTNSEVLSCLKARPQKKLMEASVTIQFDMERARKEMTLTQKHAVTLMFGEHNDGRV